MKMIWTVAMIAAAVLTTVFLTGGSASNLPPEIDRGIARACARHLDAEGCEEISRAFFADILATGSPAARACAHRVKGDLDAMGPCILGALQSGEAELREMMGAPEGTDARMLEAIAEACQREFPGDDTRAETCIRQMVDDLE